MPKQKKFDEKYIYKHALILFTPFILFWLLAFSFAIFPTFSDFVIPALRNDLAIPMIAMIVLLTGIILPIGAISLVIAAMKHYLEKHKPTSPVADEVLLRMIAVLAVMLIIPLTAGTEILSAITLNNFYVDFDLIAYPLIGISLFCAALSLYFKRFTR